MLTEEDKKNIQNYHYSVSDRSITTQLLTPLWEKTLEYIPLNIAPNLLTLLGFYSLFLSSYLTYYRFDNYPSLITMLNVLLLFIYQTLDAIDGKQARRINNSSSIGELFDHLCDNIGLIFMVFTMCWSFQIRSPPVLWLILSTAELIFLTAHMKALNNDFIVFNKYTGPGEMECLCMLILPLNLLGITIPEIYIYYILLFLYPIAGLFVIIEALKFTYESQRGIFTSLIFKSLVFYLNVYSNTYFHYFGGSRPSYFETNLTYYTYLDVFTIGVFWSVIICDVIVSKMAKKNLDYRLALFAILSLFDNMITLTFAAYYFSQIFIELCVYLGVPMFRVYNQKKEE